MNYKFQSWIESDEIRCPYRIIPTSDYERAIQCVNACAGIENPEEAIREAREALAKIAELYENPEPPTLHEISLRAYDMRCIARATLLKLQPKQAE